MEQFATWEDFWKNYRTKEVESEDDLYFQVGRTIQKKPISKDLLDALIQNIIKTLALTPTDTLVELCCGNGLCTYELHDHAEQIIAVDFAPHLIETAKQYKQAQNIDYRLASVFDFLDSFCDEWKITPHKFLMNDAIANFSTADLEKILRQIAKISGGTFVALFTGAPNDELKWNFYDTEERKELYKENVAKGDFMNHGIGRWWNPQDIKDACDRLGLGCAIKNQELPFSNYRMDILIKSK